MQQTPMDELSILTVLLALFPPQPLKQPASSISRRLSSLYIEFEHNGRPKMRCSPSLGDSAYGCWRIG